MATSPFALAQDKAKDTVSGDAATTKAVVQQPSNKPKAPVRQEQRMYVRKMACEKEAAANNLSQVKRKQYVDACMRK